MAIGITAAANRWRRTANAPPNSSMTHMVDFVVLSDRGAAVDQPLIFGAIATYTESYGITYESASLGGAMRLSYVDGGVATSVSFPSRPDTGRPFCLYLRCSGTGAGQYTGGWCYPGGPWVTASSTLAATVDQAVRIEYGSLASTFYSDCLLQNIKVWDRALTDAELLAERDSAEPVSALDYLNFYAPSNSPNDPIDRGWHGRDIERTGTFTQGYIDFKRPAKHRRRQVPYLPVAAVNNAVFYLRA